MGHESIPYQFLRLFWLGISAQTLLKAKTGDRAPTVTKSAQAQSRLESPLMFETYPKRLCSRAVPTTPLWL